jgi:hypothetical protein
MNSITMFDGTKESLSDLLRGVRDGRPPLPDFQQGWVWDDEHIRSLLASVSLAYPIGAVMMLQTGNPGPRLARPGPQRDHPPADGVVPVQVLPRVVDEPGQRVEVTPPPSRQVGPEGFPPGGRGWVDLGHVAPRENE